MEIKLGELLEYSLVPDKDENLDQGKLAKEDTIKQKGSLQSCLEKLQHILVEEDNSAKGTEKEGKEVGGK